ncbi:hypothetical protein ES703_32915 [subsurface metagenome]
MSVGVHILTHAGLCVIVLEPAGINGVAQDVIVGGFLKVVVQHVVVETVLATVARATPALSAQGGASMGNYSDA